ncbi:hypothetical protein [Streptomyces sp. NPDC005181]|uniref:hypothetical protein n=1 Tax=Streptomyces sp. NPDC005181 TaxID=3156869 RepID=UPI0033A9C1C5
MVLRDGRIIPSGPSELLYRSPADPWVAGFVGEAVWLPAALEGDRARTPLGAPHDAALALRLDDGTPVAARIFDLAAAAPAV